MNTSSMLPSVQETTKVSFAEIHIPEPRKLISAITPENIKPTAVIKTATMTIALSNDIADDLLSKILREVSHA